MLPEPCDTTVDKLWIAAVSAVLGGLLTVLIGRVTGYFTRRDRAREHAAELCTHGLPLVGGLRDLHKAWLAADSQGAKSAQAFWSLYPQLVTTKSATEFIELCRKGAPLSHAASAQTLATANAVEALLDKHESVRQLLLAPTKAAHERGQYGQTFLKAMNELARCLYEISQLAPSDSKAAVKAHSAIGEYRGNV